MDLQEDLTNLQNWSDKWLLQFNAEKCKVMHVGDNYSYQCFFSQVFYFSFSSRLVD